MNTRINWGSVAEYHCAAELLKQGFNPCWPSVDTQPYDMIVDTVKGPRRVQVKSSVQDGATIQANFKMKSGATERGYTLADCDYIVMYLFAYKLWYIFPVGKVGRAVRLKPANPNCRWEKYKEAWHLIKGKV